MHDVKASETPEAVSSPFIQVPLVVLRDKALSHAAKLAYGRLLLYAGHDGRCNPSQATIAQELCLSERQVRAVLTELKERGWIVWSRTRTSCWYEITGPLPVRKKTSVLDNTVDNQDRKFSAGQTGSFPPVRPEVFRRQKEVVNKGFEKISAPLEEAAPPASAEFGSIVDQSNAQEQSADRLIEHSSKSKPAEGAGSG